MFIRTQNEIISLMPTARWDRVDQLLGYLEEEERVALEPLLGMPLYRKLCEEYERLRDEYGDITSTTIRQDRRAKEDPELPHADVTDSIDRIQAGLRRRPCEDFPDELVDVPEEDMAAVRLIRACQQIEFYRMLAHKAGLLTVSFNEGGGMNLVSADGYDSADEKHVDRVVRDAFMSAGRATDSLLLLLEEDVKDKRYFSELWEQADAYYLHKDLLFQTARVLNEYLDIKGERMTYVQLVRDIRFCQNTYLRPRIGGRLLRAAVAFANGEGAYREEETDKGLWEELVSLLRQALAFYVESRRTEAGPKNERLARRDTMNDAQQAMAMACQFVEDNLDGFGDEADGSPIYNAVRAREMEQEQMRRSAEETGRRMACRCSEQARRRLFTSFPATHRTPEHK